jgi:hypothetical protein
MESPISAMKLLRTLEEQNKHKLAVGFINGTITLYDLNLNPLRSTNIKAINEEVI